MRVVLQRVKKASVHIDNNLHSSIEKGLLLLVGIKESDTEDMLQKIAKKCVEMRIFEDENQKMNLSIQDVHGEILSVSQFTLYADCKKGRRPGFSQAARPEVATPLYNRLNEILKEYGINVKTGIFGADMQVSLLNDGPVTIILDSEEM